jgi:hypothetical protein
MYDEAQVKTKAVNHDNSDPEDSIIINDVNESNENNVENRQTGKSNESKRAETQHKERPVNRDNAGGKSKGKGRTVIVGDSIVKGLDQFKLSRATKQNIGVRCFPGATVQDMKEIY